MLEISRREDVLNSQHYTNKAITVIAPRRNRRTTPPPLPETALSVWNTPTSITEAYNHGPLSDQIHQNNETSQVNPHCSRIDEVDTERLKSIARLDRCETVREGILRDSIASRSEASMGQHKRTGKPLPASPGPDLPDKDAPYRVPVSGAVSRSKDDSADEENGLESASTTMANDYYHVPSLRRAASLDQINLPEGHTFNRLVSTASISTTKASRGSPPPPETPPTTTPRGGQPSYPFSPDAYHAQIAQQTRDQGLPQAIQLQPTNVASLANEPQSPTRARATSATAPASTLPSTTYSSRQATPQQPPLPTESRLERDMTRVRIEDPPPPAYGTVHGPNTSVTEDKALAADEVELANLGVHPALSDANALVEAQQAQANSKPSSSSAQQPPPLPEGWISHLDAKSGQYYYIHLPTQATQWEFPKNPMPINLPEPISPSYSASVYGMSSYDRSLPSPGIVSQYATYPPHMYSMSPMASPTAAGFMQAPPSAGLEQFRVAPANGVYFGPYLRYTNMDIVNGIWHGSIMLITEMPIPPTMHIHKSNDLSPNPRQIQPALVMQHQKWTAFRFDMDIRMEEAGDVRWTYAVTSHLGCTRFEFVVAGHYDLSWRFLAHSGNDFSMNVNLNDRTRLGGLGLMWKDVLQKNQEVGGFHVQLGVGNQIVADRLWKDLPSLRQWTSLSGKDNRKNAPWSTQIEEEVRHAYFHYYTSHFDQPHLREAFASIPHVLTLDDHEIFDGFGSYPDHLQQSSMFKNIGRIGIESYLLFQHHTTLDLLRSPASFASRTTPSTNFDLFTITGTGWHFLKYLGPAIVVVAPDCRSERNMRQVMAGPSYQGLFPKVALLPPCVQHIIWLLPTPMLYPRFEMAENLANSFATTKKLATGSFNALTKVTSSVAGIVGAKGIVTEGFSSVKKAVGKSGLMSNFLSPFGEAGIMDEVRDQWTHESKDLERTYLIRTLQDIAAQKHIRMTFLSGGTNCAAAGLFHDPMDSSISHSAVSSTPAFAPETPGSTFSHRPPPSPYFSPTSSTFVPKAPNTKTMYQVTTSSIVNAPPSSTTLKLLYPTHSQPKPVYIPKNGVRSSDPRAGSSVPSDTKEDMLEVFTVDVDGRPREGRELKRLMGRRGWVSCVGFDPVFVRGAFSEAASQGSTWSGSQVSTPMQKMMELQSGPSSRMSWGGSSVATLTPNRSGVAGSVQGSTVEGPGRISLAFDFMIQAEGGVGGINGGSATVKYGPIVVPGVEY